MHGSPWASHLGSRWPSRAPSGSATLPSYGFATFPTTGFYAQAGPELVAVVNGVAIGRWQSSGYVQLSGSIFTAAIVNPSGVDAVTDFTGVMRSSKGSADPAAPAANKGLLYLRDNGGGKMQYAARFPTGAIKPIVEEPTTVQTVDATVTTLLSYTPTDEKVTTIFAIVSACRSDGGAGASYMRRAAVRRDGGVTVLVGAVETIGADKEDVAGWDVTIDVSTPAARVRVTGAAATTINWAVDVWTVESP